MTDLERLLDAHRNEGRRRYAAWDGPLYEAVARGPAAALWQGLAGQADAKSVFNGYLRLVQEAVGIATERPFMSAADLSPVFLSAVTAFGLPCRIVASTFNFAPCEMSFMTGAESANPMSYLPTAISCAVVCDPFPGSIATSSPTSL